MEVKTFATDSARFSDRVLGTLVNWLPEQLVNKVRRLLKQCRGQRFAGAFIHGSKATSLPVNFSRSRHVVGPVFQFTGELTIGLL